MSDERPCLFCNENKPLAEFYVLSGGKKTNNKCKDCFAKDREARNANSECRAKKRSYQRKYYNKEGGGRDRDAAAYQNPAVRAIRDENGRRYRKTPKGKETAKQRAIRYAERRRERQRVAYQRDMADPIRRIARLADGHLRRTRKRQADGKFTAKDVAQILVAQRCRCAACRKSIRRGYEIDHIIPVARGGSNRRSNIQLLCKPCNRAKHSRDPIDFMQSLGRLL